MNLMTVILETPSTYSALERIVQVNSYMMYSGQSFNHTTLECPTCIEPVTWPDQCWCGDDPFRVDSDDCPTEQAPSDDYSCRICDGGMGWSTTCGCCGSAQCSVYCGCRCPSEFFCADCKAYHQSPCRSLYDEDRP